MIILYSLLFCFLSVFDTSFSATTQVAGVFKGKPVFIQNTYDPDSREFCISSIRVNNRSVKFNSRLSAIKLDFEGVEPFSPVTIEIIHRDSCNPIIINPDAIYYHSIFSFDKISVTDSALIWQTLGEKESGTFAIEKIEGGIWREESIIQAKGKFEGARYIYDHQIDEGSYKFRIKYNHPDGKYLYSREIDFHFYPEPVTFKPKKTNKMIFFSRASYYQIYDAGGNQVMDGTGKEADVSRLPTGDYVIYFNRKDPGLFIRE